MGITLIEEKPVGAMGRMVIPVTLRDSCHMEEGTIVKFYKTDDNNVLLVSGEKPEEKTGVELEEILCCYCNQVKQGFEVRPEKSVCLDCASQCLR